MIWITKKRAKYQNLLTWKLYVEDKEYVDGICLMSRYRKTKPCIKKQTNAFAKLKKAV